MRHLLKSHALLAYGHDGALYCRDCVREHVDELDTRVEEGTAWPVFADQLESDDVCDACHARLLDV